jgi:hypothetical protein
MRFRREIGEALQNVESSFRSVGRRLLRNDLRKMNIVLKINLPNAEGVALRTSKSEMDYTQIFARLFAKPLRKKYSTRLLHVGSQR